MRLNPQIEAEAEAISASGAALSAALERTMMALCEMSVAAADTNESATHASDSVGALREVHGEIAMRAEAAMRLTRQGVGRAESSAMTFQQLAAAIEKIQTFSAHIQRLAKQTHLIALNATIESARAGAAGRGFSVVASEVKRLADQTNQMSKQISHEVDAIQHLAATARDSVGAVIADVGAIDTETAGIVEALETQKALTRGLADHAQRSADQMAKMSSEISEVQMTIAETGDAYAQLTRSVEALTAEAAR